MKQKILWLLVGLISLILIVILSSFVTLRIVRNSENSAVVTKNLERNNSQNIEKSKIIAEEKIPEEKIDLTGDVIWKGEVQWIEPQDLGDLGLTSKEIYDGGNFDMVSSEGVKYLKVGDVTKGKYAGAEIIDVVSWVFEGPGSSSPGIFRVLKHKGEIIFLARNTNDFDEYIGDFIKTYFFNGPAIKKLDNQIVIEELIFPKEINGENERQKFTRNNYENAFFVTEKLRPAFVHPQFGQVWVTDEKKILNPEATSFGLNSHWGFVNGEKVRVYDDIFTRHGFYFKAPDGTAVGYKLVIDIFEKQERFSKLQVVWNNGEVNGLEYEMNPSGCGGGDLVYNETLNVSLKDNLVAVGETGRGDALYGYKDTSLEGFSDLYNNIYWPGEGSQKKTATEFLKMNPKVFWVDPFGRILAFYRSDIISPAECGKPVVYLYPQKPMNIDVNVFPGNGISFSDPEIGNGWKVFSDEQSNIKNLADGKTYPYLFWEGAGDVYYKIPEQGFVVASGELNDFFDEKLAKLGLISKEINDFKEFWIPKMQEEKKPYYFVTFLSKRYIDTLAPLSVSPQPDSVIRVLMDFQGLDRAEKVSELKITTPERNGFTVVEWGGMLK